MKRLFVLLALSTLSLIGAAQTPPQTKHIGNSYKPSAKIAEQLESSVIWAEVYPIKEPDISAALARAVQEGVPPADTAIAVILGNKIHFKLDNREAIWGETVSRLTRNGAPIEYDEKCEVIPQIGDRLVITYSASSKDKQVVLDASVVDDYAFGALVDGAEPVKLDLRNPVHCEAKSHTRTFFKGKLSLIVREKMQESHEVLVQSIVAP